MNMRPCFKKIVTEPIKANEVLAHVSKSSEHYTKPFDRCAAGNSTTAASNASVYESKNLAIANRSRVNCAHNALRASIGLNITP